MWIGRCGRDLKFLASPSDMFLVGSPIATHHDRIGARSRWVPKQFQKQSWPCFWTDCPRTRWNLAAATRHHGDHDWEDMWLECIAAWLHASRRPNIGSRCHRSSMLAIVKAWTHWYISTPEKDNSWRSDLYLINCDKYTAIYRWRREIRLYIYPIRYSGVQICWIKQYIFRSTHWYSFAIQW